MCITSSLYILQAPSGLPLNNYTVQITVLGNTTNLTLPGTSTTWTFPNPISNTAYRFTVQAINDGGPGPMSGVMIGFFCDGNIYRDLYEMF